MIFAFVTIWAGSLYVVDDKPISSTSIWLLSALWLIPAAIAFLQEYRDGVLGRVSLETPDTRRSMLQAGETPSA